MGLLLNESLSDTDVSLSLISPEEVSTESNHSTSSCCCSCSIALLVCLMVAFVMEKAVKEGWEDYVVMKLTSSNPQLIALLLFVNFKNE